MRKRSHILTSCFMALTVLAACTGCGKQDTDTDSKTESVAEETGISDSSETEEKDGSSAEKKSSADENDCDSSSDSGNSDAGTGESSGNGGESGEGGNNSSDGGNGSNGNSGDNHSNGDNSNGNNGSNGNNNSNNGSNNGGTADQTQGGGAQPQGDEFAVGSEPTIGIGSIKASAGQKSVKVPVSFWNNPGFSSGGIKIYYDPALMLTKSENNPDKKKYEEGAAAEGMIGMFSNNDTKHLAAYVLAGTENSTVSGELFSFFVDIPDDAAPGTVYTFTVEIAQLTDIGAQNVSAEIIGGEIRIE